jgi:hypothetical protein
MMEISAALNLAIALLDAPVPPNTLNHRIIISLVAVTQLKP